MRDREAPQRRQQPRRAEHARADQLAQLVAVLGVRQQHRVGPHHQRVDLHTTFVGGDPVHAQAGLGAGVAQGGQMLGLHRRAVVDPVVGMAMGQDLESRIGLVDVGRRPSPSNRTRTAGVWSSTPER